MTLGLYEERARRRQRVRWNIIKWMLGLGLMAGAGFLAYDTGSSLAEQELAAQAARLSEYETTVDRLERETARLRYALENAESRMAEQRARYQRDVPQGRIAELLDLARDKLGTGVTPDRLAFLISSAANQRDCDGAPVSKRGAISTL